MVQSLPIDPEAARHSELTAQHLRQRIVQSDGWLSFERWMAEALYAPGLGYYAAGNVKLPGSLSPADHLAGTRTGPSTGIGTSTGSGTHHSAVPAGDFVTSPELTPVFARTLARQVADILRAANSLEVLEFGAGTGALAADLIDTLDTLGLSVTYSIIEVSSDLRAVQQRRLAAYGERVVWRESLPTTFCGCVVANEVLDAMPVTAFRFNAEGMLCERGVVVDDAGGFTWADRPATAALQAALVDRVAVMPGYASEINLQAEAWMAGLATWLERGAALLIDYGFPQSEYYHPQRAGGTLMAHLSHHAHDDVLAAPGIQDITAHVDFTAMAQAALDGGLDLLGYTTQARFLLNAGIAEVAPTLPDPVAQARELAAVNKLLSEAEMGELFKVLAVGRGLDDTLKGFAIRDRRHML